MTHNAISTYTHHYLLENRENLNRKTHLSLPATANLAFRWPLTYLTPSVFHADQHGMLTFLIRTLGPVFWHHPQPHGEPQHQEGQELILEHIS